MAKLQAAQIFVAGMKLVSGKIEDKDTLKKIEETKLKQKEILKTKEVDLTNLNMVIQL